MNSREIDGRTLTLAASGWTYQYTFVLYDYETESLWHPVGEGDGTDRFLCISGEFAGRKLNPLPSELTTWRRWVNEHPETWILK